MPKSKKSKQNQAQQPSLKKEAQLDIENALDELQDFNNFDKFTGGSDHPEVTEEAKRNFASQLENLNHVIESTRQKVQLQSQCAVDMLLSKSRATAPKASKKSKRKVAQEQEESAPVAKINLQDLFNGLREGGAAQEARAKAKGIVEEEQKRITEERKNMSPRSKRMLAWELEDSDEEEQDDDATEDLSFPETCLCLICNAQLGSPEEAKEHIDKTFHKNMEMVNSIPGFAEEFDHSYQMFKSSSTIKKTVETAENKEEPPAWEQQLKFEFNLIFELEGDSPENAAKYFAIFQPKIQKSMTNQDKAAAPSLFQNIPLKLEIFEFIQAQRKIYKCHSCDQPPFSSLQDLKDHIQSTQPKEKTKKSSKIEKLCAFTDAQAYLYNI